MAIPKEVLDAKRRLRDAEEAYDAADLAAAEAAGVLANAEEERDAADVCYRRAIEAVRATSLPDVVRTLALDAIRFGIIDDETHVSNGHALLVVAEPVDLGEFHVPPLTKTDALRVTGLPTVELGTVSARTLARRCKAVQPTDPRNEDPLVVVKIEKFLNAMLVRRYVLAAARVVNDATISVGTQDGAAVVFSGAGWRAYVMSLRDADGTQVRTVELDGVRRG